jgi:hypothetical protein
VVVEAALLALYVHEPSLLGFFTVLPLAPRFGTAAFVFCVFCAGISVETPAASVGVFFFACTTLLAAEGVVAFINRPSAPLDSLEATVVFAVVRAFFVFGTSVLGEGVVRDND